MNRTTTFVKETAVVVALKIKDFIIGLYNHLESVAVLSLSAMGLSTLMGELPFLAMLPAFIEGPMVIPVVAVLIIAGLMKLAEHRHELHVA